MRRGRAVAGLALVCAAALLAPAGAGALDSDLKHGAFFRLDASNGYSILVLANSERLDGQGEIVLLVGRKGASAIYQAPAVLTDTRIEADLGRLGRVSLDLVSTAKRKVKPGCGKPRTETVELQTFEGVFRFRGEEAFTEVTATTLSEDPRLVSEFICGPRGSSGEITGLNLPGARLRLYSGGESDRLSLQANKNRPRARSWFEVEAREARGRVSISRTIALRAGAAAFQYDPLLETAMLHPPAPFSGRANFYRRAAPENRWLGNLTVDLPGRSDVPLTATDAQLTLVPACLQRGGSGTRAACGL